MFLLLFLQVQYSGGSCSDTNTGYFIGFSAVFFFVCAISVAQLVIIISVQNNKKSKVMKILSVSVILPQQRKQPTFCDATSGFPMKICLRNGCVNSVLMSLHHSDLGRASDWLKQIYNAAPPIRRTTQIWVFTCHQYGISSCLFLRRHFTGKPVLVSQMVAVLLWLQSYLLHYDNDKFNCTIQ